MLPSPDRAFPNLIKTKFSAPQRRAGLVLRPRLMRMLSDGLCRPLTLICAPAGYGKTTLLAEWIANPDGAADRVNPTVCWLSLDQNDDDPALFLSYLVAALENNRPPAESPLNAILSVVPLPPIQNILGLLINDLVDQGNSILLVLDDYQFITHPVIQDGLAFFIDHLPPNVHLVLITRSDPPFPLSRLRVRGQLAEIRADDLRFTIEETTCFLNRMMALGLKEEHVSQLDERTEGWAAGLQMAGLALASHPDTAVFVQSFSGSHRFILDYLIEEVLLHQPEDIQSFLLQTSVLENLCASLCDAVMPLPSESAHRSSQQMLEYLERANLFLIPLDSERNWYRYHHLFADLLHARLDQQDPMLACELHRRASLWYEDNQRQPEAIDHALAGGDVERACTLIEGQVPYRVTHNGMGLLLGWIRELPAEMAHNRPWLCIAQAWSLMFTTEMDQCEPLLQSAERNIPPEMPAQMQNELRGHLACLWAAFYALIYDESQRTIEMARQALTYLPESESVVRTFATYLVGRTYFLYGDFSQALTILIKNSQDCMQTAATNYLAYTLSIISRICRIEGRLGDAIERVKDGCAYIEACDPRRVTVAGIAYNGQVDVLREWNHLGEAEALARQSLDLLIPWESPGSICTIYNWMIRIYLAQGKYATAEAMLNTAIATLRGRTPMAGVLNDLKNAQVLYWVTTGQVQKASQWALEQEKVSSTEDDYPICREQDEMTLARVQIAEGRSQQALMRLEPLAQAAEQFGRFGRLIEMHILQALAYHVQGETMQALHRLENALGLAEPEGYLRIFLDEREPMRELLTAYIQSKAPKHRIYAQKIISAFSIQASNTTHASAATDKANALQFLGHPDDVLTSREIEVLQRMAEGFSNRQIAQQLILAEGTVKFYIHSIYEKLDAHNRTKALIEAKKRKLI